MVIARLVNRLSGKHNRVDEDSTSSSWKVVRLAARSSEARKKDGGSFKAKQRKVSCEKLEIGRDGVTGTAKGLFFSKYTIKDFNYYRSQGAPGRFEPNTKDRAVMIATVAAYNVLQNAVDKTGKIKVERGDLGENILIDGPAATESTNKGFDDGLFVGAKIKIGTALLEVTEANNPCYRFNTNTWAPRGESLWGKTAPEGNSKNWFKSPHCPLNNKVNPGIRGWLCKVLEVGETTNGDTAQMVKRIASGRSSNKNKEELNNEDVEEKKLKLTKRNGNADDGDDALEPSPKKKQKTTN